MLKVCKNCGISIFVIENEDDTRCPECGHVLEEEI